MNISQPLRVPYKKGAIQMNISQPLRVHFKKGGYSNEH